MIDKTVFENKIAAYYTLGCKLNFAETSTIGKVLAEQGVRKARPGEKADICVVNTCSVTELADKKCRQAIRRIGKQHPGAFIVVTGCYAQLKPEEVSHIEGVDLVLGAEQKLDLLSGRSEKERRGRRHNRFPDERYPYFLPFLLGRRPYAPFPESAGRMRLFLFLLHDPLCPRTQSQRDDRQHGEAGRRGRLKRGKRDRADRRQHRRLREEHRGDVYRPDPRPRQGGRDRTLPYLLHRTEPDHGRGDRFRGMQQTFRSSFSYSVTERKRRGAETDAPPLRHDPVPA